MLSVTFAATFGVPMLLLPASLEGSPLNLLGASADAWVVILYLTIFATILAFIWWLRGIIKIGADKASVFVTLTPLTALVLSAIILTEPITISHVLGVGLVMVGINLVNNGR